MLTKFDKAYVAAAVSFIALTLMNFTGIELDAQVQAGIVAVITAALVWLVPNKA